jgi:hypothetical protein
MFILLCPIFWPIGGLIAGSSLILIVATQFLEGIIPGITTVIQLIAITFLLLAF